jgi:hypothetical protein
MFKHGLGMGLLAAQFHTILELLPDASLLKPPAAITELAGGLFGIVVSI